MKLLLDEMYWPALAEQLVARGHDVVAAKARRDLTGMPDAALFAAARHEGHAMVTENVGDYIPIAQESVASGTPHHGLILVAPSRYPRDRANEDATLGKLVTALDALIERDPDTTGGAWVAWL